MGVSKPKLFFGKVMHGRLFPKRNQFTYNIYYLAIPLSQIRNLPIAYNRFAALSFHDKDHVAAKIKQVSQQRLIYLQIILFLTTYKNKKSMLMDQSSLFAAR